MDGGEGVGESWSVLSGGGKRSYWQLMLLGDHFEGP